MISDQLITTFFQRSNLESDHPHYPYTPAILIIRIDFLKQFPCLTSDLHCHSAPPVAVLPQKPKAPDAFKEKIAHDKVQVHSPYPLLALHFLTGALGGTSAADVKKAKTIDELAKMYDSTGCKQCHEDIYNEWMQSIHSRSIFGTGRTAATIKTTVAVGLMGWQYSGVKKPEDVQVKHLHDLHQVPSSAAR